MSELLPLWDRIRNRARELNPPIAPNIDLVETIVRDELEAVKQLLDDADVLIQAADYLGQLGGGPMEDRLRLLHSQVVKIEERQR